MQRHSRTLSSWAAHCIVFISQYLTTGSYHRRLSTSHAGGTQAIVMSAGPRGEPVLFSKDYSATDLVRMIQKKSDLAVTPISKRFVEAYLPDNG